jgi:hypothetical protein
MRIPVEDFFEWDPVHCIYYPKFNLQYDVWREAITKHYCPDKRWLVETIRETAKLAQQREYPFVFTNWQLLVVMCEELLRKNLK